MSELGEIFQSSNLANYHHKEDVKWSLLHPYLDNVHLGVLQQLGEHWNSLGKNNCLSVIFQKQYSIDWLQVSRRENITSKGIDVCK